MDNDLFGCRRAVVVLSVSLSSQSRAGTDGQLAVPGRLSFYHLLSPSRLTNIPPGIILCHPFFSLPSRHG
jgi:hypothetical protein